MKYRNAEQVKNSGEIGEKKKKNVIKEITQQVIREKEKKDRREQCKCYLTYQNVGMSSRAFLRSHPSPIALDLCNSTILNRQRNNK